MDSVFQELKRAREARHLSIEDVSDATLINVTFLEAIEQGNTTVLPQTYVRAFIREYANVVGLDPHEIMMRYDLANAEKPPADGAEKQPAIEPRELLEEKKDQKETERSHQGPTAPTLSRFAFPAILILTAGVIIWNLSRTKEPPSREELPLEIAAEHHVTADSMARRLVPEQSGTGAVPDSLTLRAVLTDSAWVQIVIDDQTPLQYMFRPNRRIDWKAKQRFRLSTGNAGAIDLTLNDKHLGAPGKRRAIIRNMEFNRQTLQLQ